MNSHIEVVKKTVNLLWKRHRSMKDIDGFYMCEEMDIKCFRVAGKKDWRGTEKERQQAIKQHKSDLKNIKCEFCQFCMKVLKELRKAERVK